MTIFEANSIEELKTCGTLADVKEAFRKEADKHGFKGKVNSWANMFESIQEYKRFKGTTAKQPAKKETTVETVDTGDLFFKSRAARLIFFLTQADGEMRMKELGVNRKHYADNDFAKKWMTDLMKVIHPDVCNHPLAADAASEVNRIYRDMAS